MMSRSSFEKEIIMSNSKWIAFQKEPAYQDAERVLDEYLKWLKDRHELQNDSYYDPSETVPQYGDWGIDDNQAFANTWEQAREQMSTTKHKFAIESKHNIKIGKLFQSLGFMVIECWYSSWRLGYDYSIVDLGDDSECRRDAPDYEFICLTAKNPFVRIGKRIPPKPRLQVPRKLSE